MKSSTNKILTIAVVLLLLVNIALIFFMVKGKDNAKRPTGRGNSSDMMAKELNMTEEQKKEHKQLKEEHLKNVKPLFDSVRAAKTALYSLLKDSTINDSIINIYSQRIGERQAAIEKQTFAHFKRKRSMFTAEQQPKFDSFILKMMQGGRKDSTDKRK